MSQEFERFATYLKVSDRLIEQASEEDMAETARVLALHLAHYQKKYHAIPRSGITKAHAHGDN